MPLRTIEGSKNTKEPFLNHFFLRVTLLFWTCWTSQERRSQQAEICTFFKINCLYFWNKSSQISSKSSSLVQNASIFNFLRIEHRAYDIMTHTCMDWNKSPLALRFSKILWNLMPQFIKDVISDHGKVYILFGPP